MGTVTRAHGVHILPGPQAQLQSGFQQQWSPLLSFGLRFLLPLLELFGLLLGEQPLSLLRFLQVLEQLLLLLLLLV